MKYTLKSIVTALVVLIFAACSSTDLSDPASAEEYRKAQEMAKIEQKKHDYETNFVKKYGKVDPNQSWDFSSGMPSYSLPSSARNAQTRAGGYERTNSTDYYEFPGATITKMKEVFGEGKDNRKMGTAFGMKVPENAFTIMPMYMGQSGGNFELWMHVDGIAEDIKVWSKWQDMQVKGRKDGKDVNWTDVKTFDSSANCSNATAIRSKYYTFSGLPANANMYFYLKITAAANGYNQMGEMLSSINDYMREYKFGANELPTNLPGVTNPEVMIIGCEDAFTENSDYDFNDVVFMIYGDPYVPTTFEVTEVEKTYSKRYMIEDLGATDDFDFNDIVVDVFETYTQEKKTSSQGHVTWGPETLKGQKAILRHLGGVLPFELTIGNTTLDKMGSEATFQTSPDTEFEVTGWDRTANNISIKVYQNQTTQTAVNVNFPQAGAIPMIIATDTNVKWAVEREAFDWESYMKSE